MLQNIIDRKPFGIALQYRTVQTFWASSQLQMFICSK